MKANQVHRAVFLVRVTINAFTGIEKLLEELQKQNAEQRELLNNLSESEFPTPVTAGFLSELVSRLAC
jgi:hypothetical protein